MRRERWVRLVAAWLACWVPLVLVDGGRLHACPMHDGAGAAAMAIAMGGGSAPAGTDAMRMSGPVAAAHHGWAHHHHQSGGGHACSCVGACCAAVAVLPNEAPPAALATIERPPAAPTGRPQHEWVAAWVDFVLPFATAPPRATSI